MRIDVDARVGGDISPDVSSDAALDAVSDALMDASLDVRASDAGQDAGTARPEFSAGTRLRARYNSTADGLRDFIGWFDRTLNTNCQFQRAADGRMRCLPEDSYGVSYGDAACSARNTVVPTRMCVPMPRFASEPVAGRCGRNFIVAGDPLSPTPTGVYLRSGSDCVMVGVGSMEQVRPLGAPMAPGMFVGADEVRGGSGRLMGTWLVAEDGAIQRVGWYDTVLNSPCLREIAVDGSSRCIPSGQLAQPPGGLFGDSTCTGAVSAAVDVCDSAEVRFATMLRGGACDLVTQAWALGATVSAGAVHRREMGTACVPVGPTPPAGTTYHAVREELAAARMAPIELGAPPAGRRLGRRVETGASGEPPREARDNYRDTIFDRVLNIPCTARLAADGMTRCLPMTAFVNGQPSSAVLVNAYSDAACTRLLGLRGSPASGCAAAIPSYGIQSFETPDCAGRRTRVYSLGAPTTPSTVYVRNNDGTCSASPTPGQQFFEVGAEVPAGTFMALVEASDG